MNKHLRQKGFSLTEVLMATGILAMGLMLVAMAFPVGVKLVSVSTERTIGVVAGGEAVAKMRLYGIRPFTDPNWPANPNTACTDYQEVCTITLPPNERYYPSLVPMPEEKRYCWSILVRRADPAGNAVQTTVLVCRMMGMNARYYDMDSPPDNKDNLWPIPVKIQVQKIGVGNRQLKIIPVLPGSPSPEYNFFTEGCKIIENTKGQICRVLELEDVDSDGNRDLILQDDYAGPNPGDVWVVPPAVGSSRNPCISVWQSDLTF